MARAELVLGIDLGGTKVAFALAEAGGAIRARHRRPTEASGSPETDVARMADELRRLMDEAGVDPAEVSAVGVSLPGPLDYETGRVDPPNLTGWKDVPIRDLLAQALPGQRVVLENDANAAALAEWRFGAGRGARDVIYLTMSTGVGGGLICDGRLVRGARGAAGEVGHAPVEWDDGELCGCGLRGCVEAYCGGRIWAERLARTAPADSRVAALAGGREHATPVHVVQAAREGDAFALAEMARFNHYLARAIAILTVTLNPSVVVLGTIAVAAGEELCLRPVREKVASHVWPSFARALRILPAELGAELPYYAGVCVALDALSIEPEPS